LGRYHSAAPITIPRQRRGAGTRLHVRLYGTGEAEPLVELVVGDHDDAHRLRVDLTLRQARTLRGALDRVLDDAARTPQPPHGRRGIDPGPGDHGWISGSMGTTP
jgi:hypothetical protein